MGLDRYRGGGRKAKEGWDVEQSEKKVRGCDSAWPFHRAVFRMAYVVRYFCDVFYFRKKREFKKVDFSGWLNAHGCSLFGDFLLEPPSKSVKVNMGSWWLRASCFCYHVCLSTVFHPSSFLVMQTVNSEVVCVVFRQEGGISRLTFWKCHKEGEIHNPPLCTSVKISQPGREMLMQEFTLLKQVWLF